MLQTKRFYQTYDTSYGLNSLLVSIKSEKSHVSSKFASAVNGQGGSNFAAAKNSHASCNFDAAKNVRLAAILLQRKTVMYM